MQEEVLWIVERRRLDTSDSGSWDMTACAIDRDEAVRHFCRHLMYIHGHEMRLIGPDGQVARYFRDPAHASWRQFPAAGEPPFVATTAGWAHEMV